MKLDGVVALSSSGLVWAVLDADVRSTLFGVLATLSYRSDLRKAGFHSLQTNTVCSQFQNAGFRRDFQTGTTMKYVFLFILLSWACFCFVITYSILCLVVQIMYK